MRIGLFFGSFNPIHNGHMVLANYFAEFSDLEAVWFVISPHNPLKEKSSLLKDHHRLELVSRAIDDYPRFRISKIEFTLPQPNYTVNTLVHLHEKYPQHEFALIMGADNLTSFNKWRNYEIILEYHYIYVYPRPGHDGGKFKDHPKVKWVNAPQMDISSTFIREAVANKKDIRFYMPEKAYHYMQEMHFYENL